MSNSRHHYSLNWLVGVSNDIWTTDDHYRSDGDIVRDSYRRIDNSTNTVNIVALVHMGPIIRMSGDGYIRSNTSRDSDYEIESLVKSAFGIYIGDDVNQWIIVHFLDGEVTLAKLGNHRLDDRSNIANGISNVYPISAGSHNEGVHIIDSFISEELDSDGNKMYTITRQSGDDQGGMTTTRIDIDSIVSVKGSLILSNDSTHIIRMDGDEVIMTTNSNPLNVRDAINYTNSSGYIEPLYILDNGNLVDKNSNLMGYGFDRFLYLEYVRGVVLIGKDEKTYLLTNDNTLEDLNIPLVVG